MRPKRRLSHAQKFDMGTRPWKSNKQKSISQAAKGPYT